MLATEFVCLCVYPKLLNPKPLKFVSVRVRAWSACVVSEEVSEGVSEGVSMCVCVSFSLLDS